MQNAIIDCKLHESLVQHYNKQSPVTHKTKMKAEDIRLEEIFVPKSQGGFPLFTSSRMMVVGTRALGQMQGV